MHMYDRMETRYPTDGRKRMYVLAWEFLAFSFIGWCAEVLYTAFTEKRFVNCGFLCGIACPIYGIMAILMIVASSFGSQDMFNLFLLSAVVGAASELVCGFVLEKLSGYRRRDYSESKYNIGGYTSLFSAFFCGLCGVAAVKVLRPLIHTALAALPENAGRTLLFVLVGVMALDFVLSVVTAVRISRRTERFCAEIRMSDPTEKHDCGSVPELKKKYDEAIADGSFFCRRMISAFPEMTESKYISRFDSFRRYAEHEKEIKAERAEQRRRLSRSFYEEKALSDEEKPFAYGLGLTKMMWLFFIGSVLGSVIETIWVVSVTGGFEKRTGVVYGYFIPVYGVGAVVMAFVLCRMYKKRDFFIFVGSAVIGAATEYFCSVFQEFVLGTRSWDYSGSFLNIGGRTNLLYAFMWGVLGVLWVREAYPFISSKIEKIPKRAGRVLTVILAVAFSADMLISAAAVYRQNERREGVEARGAVGAYLDYRFDDESLADVYPEMKKASKD